MLKRYYPTVKEPFSLEYKEQIDLYLKFTSQWDAFLPENAHYIMLLNAVAMNDMERVQKLYALPGLKQLSIDSKMKIVRQGIHSQAIETTDFLLQHTTWTHSAVATLRLLNLCIQEDAYWSLPTLLETNKQFIHVPWIKKILMDLTDARTTKNLHTLQTILNSNIVQSLSPSDWNEIASECIHRKNRSVMSRILKNEVAREKPSPQLIQEALSLFPTKAPRRSFWAAVRNFFHPY